MAKDRLGGAMDLRDKRISNWVEAWSATSQRDIAHKI